MKKVRNGFINNLRYFCLLAVIVFGLIAIVGSNGGGDSGSGDGDGDNITGGQSLTITGKSGNQVNLNGSWSAGCIANEVQGASKKSVITISGTSISGIHNIWMNSTDCSGTSDFTWNSSGTFTLGGEVTATLNGSPVTATKTDTVTSTAQITIYNEDIVSDFNTDNNCGYTDWAVGVPKDVLGTDCVHDTSNIIYIDDTADPDLWYYGIVSDESGTLDANGYPTILDPDDPIARM